MNVCIKKGWSDMRFFYKHMMFVYSIKTWMIGNRLSFSLTDAKTGENLVFSVIIEISYSLFAGKIPAAYIAYSFYTGDFVPRRIITFRQKPVPIFIPFENFDFITRIQLKQFFTGKARRRTDVHFVINDIMSPLTVIYGDVFLCISTDNVRNKQKTTDYLFHFYIHSNYMGTFKNCKPID